MSVSQKFPIPVDDGTANHLKNLHIPSISLPNQEGNNLLHWIAINQRVEMYHHVLNTATLDYTRVEQFFENFSVYKHVYLF